MTEGHYMYQRLRFWKLTFGETGSTIDAGMVLGFSRAVDCLVGVISPWEAIASFVLLPSAADRLPFPFRALAQTPQLTLVLAGGGYLAFLILFLPLYAISFLVTATGAWLLLLGGVYMGGRGVTQTISYPGASKQIQRDIELEYTKNVSGRLISFVNSLRLWFQLVRDVTVVPSGMSHFRALHREIQGRVRGGDIWVLTRALEELTANAKATVEEGVVRGEGASTASANPAAAAASAAAAAGANALAPSAAAEAEAILECLSGLLPMLEDALRMTAKLPDCSSTFDFDRARQNLLAAGVGGDDRLDSTFESLEGMTSKLMKLSRQLRRRKKNGNSNSSSGADAAASAAVAEDSVVDVEEDGVVEQGVPTEEEGGSKGSGSPGTIIKNWWKSRYPYEGAAGFGLMREEMLIKSNAQQVWLTMSDGTLLDCCYGRAYGGRNGVGGIGGQGHGGQPSDVTDGDGRRSTGCVLFCNPNAGYYESMVLAGDSNRTWVSFYTSAGCDVFLFNYRGYGRSGGKASPSRINKDVREVVVYLREQLGVTRLAVHGESIGGVAAASVARHCQVDLLVLDRTFSSLSGVAQRLLGGWTKWAIWGFTGWETDVVSDYLACQCYKVLACDPEDVIIAEPSSTKAGVSITVELGASSSPLDVYHPPKAYKVADHTRSCPPMERVSLPLCPQERLSDLQIAHFTACLRYIGRRAPRVGQATPGAMGGGRNRRRRRRRRRELSMDIEAQARVTQTSELEMVSMMDDGDLEGKQEELDDAMPDPLTEGMIDVTRPLGAVWVLLSRVDGLCGRMLGRAVAKGYDDVRAWVCCLVVLGPIVRADPIATTRAPETTGSLHVELASKRLQTLQKEHPDELGSDPFVDYVSQMLAYLAQRIAPGTDCPPPALLPLEKPRNGGHRKAGGSRGSDGLASGVMLGGGHGRGAVQDASALNSLEGGLEEGVQDYGVELMGGDGRDDLLGGVPSSSSSSGGSDPVLGRVLPLRCGHNMAYDESERRMLLEHLALEGWVAPDRKALDVLAKAGFAQQ